MAGEGGGGTNTAYGVVLTVVLCAAVCVATNLVTNTQLIKSGFHFPFTLMWFTGSSKLLLSIPKILRIARLRQGLASAHEVFPWSTHMISVRKPPSATAEAHCECEAYDARPRGTVVEEVCALLLLFSFYVCANASLLIAVSTLSAGVVSAIFSTSPAFVCVLSRILLKRPFQWIEIAAITFSLSGMLCVARPWHDPDVSNAKALAAAVLAPIAAACHTTYFSHKFTGCGGVEVAFILSKMAVFLLTLGGVGVLILVAAHAEHPVWHHHMTPRQQILFPACAVTGWLFNGSTSYAVTVTYPLFVTVGMVMSTILTVIATGVIDRVWPVPLQIGGMALIGLGFALLAVKDWRSRRCVTPTSDMSATANTDRLPLIVQHAD